MLRLEIPRAEQAKPRQIPVTAVMEASSAGPRAVEAETPVGAETPAEAVAVGQA